MSGVFRWPRSIGFPLVAALWLAASSTPAAGGEVPNSALSGALQTDPVLVDSPAQLFLHPQLAVSGPSRIGSFDGGSAAGMVLSRESCIAVSALAQKGPDPYGGSRVLQAGLAGALGAVRLGAAFRDLRSQVDDTYHDFDVVTGEETRRDEHQRQTSREVAAGLAFASGRASIAVTAELTRMERRADALRVDGPSDVTQAAHLLGTKRWGGAFLVAAPAGADNLLRLAGAFRDRRAAVEGFRDDSRLPQIVFSGPVYGHDWNTGLSLEHDLGSSRSWSLHAFYSDERDPGVPRAYAYSDLRLSAVRLEYAEAGAAYRRPGWWGETQYLGVRGSLTKTTEEDTILYGGRIEIQTSFSESTSHAFSWGVSRSFGSLDLVGEVSTNLRLDATFGSVDASLRF